MILGIGIDLAELPRISKALERWGERFLNRLLTEREMAALPHGKERKNAWVAGRFAAKEAAVKALGTGFAQGIGPRNIEIITMPGGAPGMILHGAAQEKAQNMGVTRIHVSLTHERTMAAAVVIFES
ncbi:MAG: holo-[acyl-carrier-protein] synthase [Mailhella sp.]|nr:holo-[acyl-carrier-protein] synthase [Mailhella sp.]